jgi:hypothetical protein
MYNGLDIFQSRCYIKVSIKTWLMKMMAPYFKDWLEVPSTPFPTPLGSSESFIKHLYFTEGDPTPSVQAALEKQMGIKYRKCIGELIWPMSTCRPDLLCQSVIKVAQHSAAPAKVHYAAVKSIFRYLATTMDDGIIFWCNEPRLDLSDDPLPKISSKPHNIKMANCPSETADVLGGYMDSGWVNCLIPAARLLV